MTFLNFSNALSWIWHITLISHCISDFPSFACKHYCSIVVSKVSTFCIMHKICNNCNLHICNWMEVCAAQLWKTATLWFSEKSIFFFYVLAPFLHRVSAHRVLWSVQYERNICVWKNITVKIAKYDGLFRNYNKFHLLLAQSKHVCNNFSILCWYSNMTTSGENVPVDILFFMKFPLH